MDKNGLSHILRMDLATSVWHQILGNNLYNAVASFWNFVIPVCHSLLAAAGVL